jgi:hypothetical protein
MFYNQGTKAEIVSDLLFSKLRLLAKHDSLNGDWKPEFYETVFTFVNEENSVKIIECNCRHLRNIYFKNFETAKKTLDLFGANNILKMLKNGN